MGDHFQVRGKSGNFDQTGKVRKIYPKYWENKEILILEIGKITGKVREICQPEK